MSIPRKVHELHEFIDNVFIEMDPVLAQFDMYIKMEKNHNIKDPLRTATHKVMVNFVKICTLVIGIQQGGKWDKFKSHAGRVLGDDQDLQDELDKFRRIVYGLQSIQATATYEVIVEVQRRFDVVKAGVSEVQKGVDGMEANVRKLAEDQTKRNQENKKKGWLKKIKRYLDVKDDNKANPKPTQKEMAGGRLQDTGRWLFKDEKFKKWADKKYSEADSILLLTGAPGFGKSSLVSAVVDHLREAASTSGQGRRSLVAFHFLPMQKDRKLARKKQRKQH